MTDAHRKAIKGHFKSVKTELTTEQIFGNMDIHK